MLLMHLLPVDIDDPGIEFMMGFCDAARVGCFIPVSMSVTESAAGKILEEGESS